MNQEQLSTRYAIAFNFTTNADGSPPHASFWLYKHNADYSVEVHKCYGEKAICYFKQAESMDDFSLQQYLQALFPHLEEHIEESDH